MPINVTIAIPTKNAEKHLDDCLNSIPADFVKKIIVIDSISVDNTRKIAQSHGVEVIEFQWNGRFPKKRNWFLQNHRISSEWVLFLDADELLTPEFCHELRRTLPHTDKSGFWLNYSIHFLGRRLRGGYPLQKLALFRLGTGEYEKIDEYHWSNLDMEVHEHPVISGEIGEIRAKIDHCGSESMFRYIEQHNEYSSWEATRIFKAQASTPGDQRWTWKQRVKAFLVESPVAGPLYFLGSYLFMGGFRDGVQGLLFALMKGSYFTSVHCKLRELRFNNLLRG